MPKIIKTSVALSLLGTALAAALYCVFPIGILLTLAITLGTIAYHLLVRLLMGSVLGSPALVRPDYAGGWFRVRPWEQRLYKALKVKAWKNKLPTYSPEGFSHKLHSWEEIAANMCRSELVHEANAALSFVPLAFSIKFGSFGVFLATSVCGAAFDLAFVIIQRYNRGRISRLISR